MANYSLQYDDSNGELRVSADDHTILLDVDEGVRNNLVGIASQVSQELDEVPEHADNVAGDDQQVVSADAEVVPPEEQDDDNDGEGE